MNAVDTANAATDAARRAMIVKLSKLALAGALVAMMVWLFLMVCSKVVIAVNAALGAGLLAYFVNNALVTLIGWLCAKGGIAVASYLKARF
jgi:hypothetical protein